MTHIFSKGAALAAAAWLTCASAAGAPVIIDTEVKANAAAYSALKALRQPKQEVHGMTFYVRGIAENALLQLASATNPAAVRNAPNGISLPCATAGSMTARLGRGVPRVLKLQWQGCKFNDLSGYPHERNGNAEIILLSDSFVPGTVGGIRFGTLNSDFTDSRHIEDLEEMQITDELRSLNLRMLGRIPMVRAFPLYGLFVGEFAFELTGFIQEHVTADVTGMPRYENTSRTIAEFVITSGATTYNTAKTRLVEDTRLHLGKMTRTSNSSSWGESISSYTVEGLKVRQESDFVTWKGSESVDGKIDIQYNTLLPSCLNGAYTVKTRAPLVIDDLSAYRYSAGELLINGSTTAKFYSAANVPPNLPVPQLGMLVLLDVRNVGRFTYDTSDLSIFSQNTQCWGG